MIFGGPNRRGSCGQGCGHGELGLQGTPSVRRGRTRLLALTLAGLSGFLPSLLFAEEPLGAEEPPATQREAAGAEGRETSSDAPLAVPNALPTLIPRAAQPGAPSGSPGPGLDALLQLPSSYRARPSPSVAGADEAEWRRRFIGAERDLAAAREALARTKRELDDVAEGGGGSQWSVAPPGATLGNGPSTSPLSFKHRELMRKSREDLEAAERAVRDLKIEADLAGVPPAWRQAEAPGSSRAMPDQTGQKPLRN